MVIKLSLGEIEKDPILRTYHIPDKKHLCYDASGYFSPISIKDQIIRVITILDRAYKNGLISEKRPLLIVGAGIAGSIAAVHAAEMKVKTIVIDKNTAALNNIVTLSTRYICPTQYDWTAAHWNSKKFIVNSLVDPKDSIILTDGPLKTRIQNLVSILQNHNGYIVPYFSTELRISNPVMRGKNPFIQVQFKTKKGLPKPRIKNFGMALSCAGFGKEKVFVSERGFHGLEFWKITDHTDIIKEDNPDQKILICGSGDGSLQDYILLATISDTVRDLYEKLKLTSDQKFSLEDSITRAEEKIKRKEIWLSKANEKQLCQLMQELHQVHLNEVNKLLADSSIKKRIKEFLRKEKDIPNKFVASRLKVYFSCVHFSPCYPLNRFMALLISEYLRKEERIKTMYGQKLITSIRGVKHTCNKNDPDKCDENRHKIISFKKENCYTPKTPGKTEETFDTVIVRFGINGKDLIPVFNKIPAFPGKQILPYLL